MGFIKKYPFTIFFLVAFISVTGVTWRFAVKDKTDSFTAESRLDSFSLASFQFRRCVDQDTTDKATPRLLKSMMILKQRKDNALDDASYYYEFTFLYAHLLGIFSIFGSLVVLLVVTKGWSDASADLKIALGSIFMVCSVCYFIPKLMNNDQNYKGNIDAYYVYSKQLNYSIKNLSYHCCCDTSRGLMISTADSNFNVINNNMIMHEDMNFSEAARYFDDFKATQKPGKP